MKNLFKKSLALFSSVLTAGLLMVSPVSATETTTLRNGDTNSDGMVDLYDVINICKHIITPSISGANFKLADYNKDDKVDLYDAIFVTRLILCEDSINEVATRINLTRGLNNIESLEFDYTLSDAAMKRASELPLKPKGDYRPDNSSFETIFGEYGIEYSKCANCIAAVPATPKALYDALMERDDIKNRLLNADYTKIGVGYYSCDDDYKHYWAILLV